MPRIVLATFGSLGDLHPLIPVAIELRARGHQVLFATNESHRERVAQLGFEMHAIGPDIRPDDAEMMAYLLDLKRGPERLIREVIFPALHEQYAGLRAIVAGADLLVASELVHAAPLIAETTGIAWATHVLAPLSFFSAYDPPVVPTYPWLASLYRLGPVIGRAVSFFGHLVTKSWLGPVQDLRAQLRLGAGPHPLFEGKFSPRLVLAMFSSVIGRPQPDWPSNTIQTGFTFFDAADARLDPGVDAFLKEGEPPVVFTLGSSAVADPGAFFRESIAAAGELGIRALIVGSGGEAGSSSRIHVTGYAPYSAVFARARVVVHQGGIGTTAQTLRAGKPMVVVPYGFDQPDNAARVKRLGVSKTVRRDKYNRTRVAKALNRVMAPVYLQRSAEVAQQVRSEDGARAAADALERLVS